MYNITKLKTISRIWPKENHLPGVWQWSQAKSNTLRYPYQNIQEKMQAKGMCDVRVVCGFIKFYNKHFMYFLPVPRRCSYPRRGGGVGQP